jgi:hypothetical protein
MSAWLSRMLAAARLLLILAVVPAANATSPSVSTTSPSRIVDAKPPRSAIETPRDWKVAPPPAPQPPVPPDPAPPPDEPPPPGPCESEHGVIGDAYVGDELTLVSSTPPENSASAIQVAASSCPCSSGLIGASPPRIITTALSRTFSRCLSLVSPLRLRH